MRMRRLTTLALLLALLGTARLAAAAGYGEGNEAYQRGEYDRAIEIYEQLVAEGVTHEHLFYNLGNAYFRSARLGPAIYNYERALRIDPGFEDAAYNLAVAREAVAERVVDRLKGAEEQPAWVRLATFFSVSELTFAFLVLDVLFFAALIALRFLATGFVRTAVFVLSIFLGVATVGCGVLLERHLHVLGEVHQGIVLADQITMREGPDAALAERGQLHPGVKVTVLESRRGWVLVRLANGVEGWIPSAALGRL